MACLQPTNVLGALCSCTLTSGCAVCASTCGELVGYTPVGGTVCSVGLTMPSAFTVCNSPVTNCGTIAVTGAGLASQYVRGDGTLAVLPPIAAGGSATIYYFNGGVASTVPTYFQIANSPNGGAAADFPLAGNGLIAQFLSNVGNPNTVTIPAGNWNAEIYMNASNNTGTPAFYIELLKYDGSTFTSIANSSATPERINLGTSVELYYTALAVPAYTLLTTDRIAIRVYIVNSVIGRTITMYTQDAHLSSVTTTLATGISVINGLTCNTQYLTTGTACNDFTIVSSGDVHQFDLPTASATTRGALSCTDWTRFSNNVVVLGGGTCSTVRCCVTNVASGNYSAALGGQCNTACNIYATIGGGFKNVASGCYSFIGGGECNSSSGWDTVISGGTQNIASGSRTTIGGGAGNTASAQYSSVFGALCGTACGYGSTISGGYLNVNSGQFSIIGAGRSNTNSASYSNISGGNGNILCLCGVGSTISGGSSGVISVCNSGIGSGNANKICGTACYSFIGGGNSSTASGQYSAISGGKKNLVQAYNGFVGGGNCNNVCNNTCGSLAYGAAVVGGVGNNTCGGTWDLATNTFTVTPTTCSAGAMSFVGGGFQNAATGDCSAILGGSNNITSAAYSGAFGCGLTNAVACSFKANQLIAANLATAGCAVCTDANGMLVPYTSSTAALMILGSAPCSTIRCGVGNTASCAYSAALAGCNNAANGCFSVVVSGTGNTAAGSDTFIGAGLNNQNNGIRSAILGGNSNQMNALGGFIAVGNCNSVCNTGGSSCARSAIVLSGVGNNSCCGIYSTLLSCFTTPPTLLNAGAFSFIATGFQNSASGCYSTVVSGFCNISSNFGSFIGSGCCNLSSAPYGAIVTGFCNTASACSAIVTGGYCNTTSQTASVIGGGATNSIICAACCSGISSGYGNTLCGTTSYIGGGTGNLVKGLSSSVTAGNGNVALGDYTSVDGGLRNYAQATAGAILGGNCNYVCNLTSGCLAYGAVVVGGVGNNTCGGTWTLASCCFSVSPTICNAGSMSFIGGGFQNAATGDCSAILGGSNNITSALYSGAFGCGLTNAVACSFKANRLIASNLATSGCAVCTDANGMLVPYSATGGGIIVLGTAPNSTVRCGVNNLAGGDYSAVLGGFCNNFCNSGATCLVAGSVVAGGIGNNTIGGTWSVPLSCFTVAPTAICNGGFASVISGGFQNIAKCDYNGILGGLGNVTSGLYSGAFGCGVTNSVACSFASNRLIATNLATAGCAVCTDANGMLLPFTAPTSVLVASGTGNICANNFNNCIQIVSGVVCYNSILGGTANTMSAYGPRWNTIAGGQSNSIATNVQEGFIGGGQSNTIGRPFGSIAGGKSNSNSSYFGSIAGGNGNATNYCADGSSIGAGCVNYVDGTFSRIGGGSCNNIQWTPNNALGICTMGATIGGGVGNNTCGGTFTTASCCFTVAPTAVSAGLISTIGGGLQNRAQGNYSGVLGGNNNLSSGTYSAILGGCGNTASGAYSGAFGCGLTACNACTFYSNNYCACGSLYTSALTSGCAVCSTTGGQLVSYNSSNITFNRQTASYTLVLADAGLMVEMNVATANNLTIPLNSSVAFAIGQIIEITQYGAGQTTVVPTVGVTINSYLGLTKLGGQYGAATLTKVGTNEWYLFGNLTA